MTQLFYKTEKITRIFNQYPDTSSNTDYTTKKKNLGNV